MNNPNLEQDWTPDHSAALYGIREWGAGYFDLTDQGEVAVKVPFPEGEATVSLMEIVSGIEQRGHAMPLLLRIENLLDARITLLNETFRAAIASSGYRNGYRGVFPVKVNQQCQVIEEITHFGDRYGHGLEAGSKAELVLALSALEEGGLLVLNGYKDREFVDLGLWAQKLGYDAFFVVESPAELQLLIERSRALSVRPQIGARIKVSARVGGLWTETSGDRSSFGLSTAQLVAMVDTLKEVGMLDCLRLLHCHLGSQIPDIEDIRSGVLEACRFYADLVAEGAPMGHLDLGGGLAVDYTGSAANDVHSRNYDLDDYCRTLVGTVRGCLDPRGIDHPQLITESGRATVAYGTMLLFNVLEVAHFEPVDLPQSLPEGATAQVERLFAMNADLELSDLAASYTEALACRDRMRDRFRAGEVGLRQRSLSENLFLAVARQIRCRLDDSGETPAGLKGLRQSLADIYYGNFSVFQSLPDTWAIDQLFPVMPIHRHGEVPSREGIISDLTCDCDGKLDRFITAAGERRTLPLHPLRKGEEYLLGVFLMGAYQETLGDLHNLFGDTHVISVRINGDGSFDVVKEIDGDSIGDVLEMVGYHTGTLYERFRERAEQAVKKGRIDVRERQQVVEEYAARLRGYTYFER